MADLSDVRDALVGIVAGILYPNGSGQASITGQNIRIYAGWPVANQLDQDLANNIVNVTVYPTLIERNTTRYPKAWQPVDGWQNGATLAAAINGQAITLSGTVSTPQNVALIIDGKAYVHAVQSTDTLASIATALAANIVADQPATSSGAVITIPNAVHLIARIGFTAQAVKEVRRQERVIQIMVWANADPVRDKVIRAIDPVLADMERFNLPDGTSARLIYQSSPVDDNPQKEALYRRDLKYSVEYATTLVQEFTTITQSELKVETEPGDNVILDKTF